MFKNGLKERETIKQGNDLRSKEKNKDEDPQQFRVQITARRVGKLKTVTELKKTQRTIYRKSPDPATSQSEKTQVTTYQKNETRADLEKFLTKISAAPITLEYIHVANLEEQRLSSEESSSEKLHLYKLVYEGNIEALKKIISSKGSDATRFVNAEKFKRGRNLLHIAVLARQIEIVKYLRELNMDITLCDVVGENPLHYTAKEFNQEIFLALFEFENALKALNKKNDYEMLPEDYACSYNQKEFPKMLPVVFINETKRFIQAMYEKKESIESIFQQYSISDELKEPIKLIYEEDLEKLKLFFQGKDVAHFVHSNKTNDYGLSLLHIAVLAKRADIVRWFRKAGVDLEQYDVKHQTPLHYLTKEYDKKTFFALRGFKNFVEIMNEKTEYAMTPYDYAKIYKQQDFLKWFHLFGDDHKKAIFDSIFFDVYGEDTLLVYNVIKKRDEKKEERIESKNKIKILRR